MKYKSNGLLVFFLFCGLYVAAQNNFAIINDPDGFANVRKTDSQSKILGTISEHQVFDCIIDEEDVAYPNMVQIEYNKYVKPVNNYFRNDTSYLGGYIHKSRVQELSKLPCLKLKLLTENKAVFANDSISVEIETVKFDSEKHIMRDELGKIVTQTQGVFTNGHVTSIDGESAWGTDATVPTTAIKSIKIKFTDSTIVFPQSSMKNIFEPNIKADYTKISIGNDGGLYIWMQNSDGAGSYNVIWVIVNRKIKYMLIRLSWYA